MSKKTIWFQVEEEETIVQCLERMRSLGYEAIGRKEEPIFSEVNGEYVPIKQKILFKGKVIEQNTND